MRNPIDVAIPAATLENHLGYWLRRVSNHVSGSFARALQERQLSVAEWVALKQIESGAGLTPAVLADASGMTRGAVTKVLDKLESKGLVQRTASRDDNRVLLLSLTASGRRVLPALTAIADDNDEHYFSALDADERAVLRRLLEKLADVHGITGIPAE